MNTRKIISIFSIICLSSPILLNHISFVQAEETISSSTSKEQVSSQESTLETTMNDTLATIDSTTLSDVEESSSEENKSDSQSDIIPATETTEVNEDSIDGTLSRNDTRSAEEDSSDLDEGIDLHRDNYENGWTYQIKNGNAIVKSCDLSGVVTVPAKLGGCNVAFLPNAVGSTNSNLGRIFKNKDQITELNILDHGYKVEFKSTATGGNRAIQDWLLSDFTALKKANLSGLGRLKNSATGTFKNCPNLRFLDLTGWGSYNGPFTNLNSWFWGRNNGDVYNPKIPLLVKTDNQQLMSYNYDQNGIMPFPLTFSASGGEFSDHTQLKKFLNSVVNNNLDVTNNNALLNAIKSFANSLNPTKNGYKFLGFQDTNGRWLHNETDPEYVLQQSYTAQYQQTPWIISASGSIATITDYVGNKEQNLVVPTLNEIKTQYPSMYDNCTEVQITSQALKNGALNATQFSISSSGPKVKVSGDLNNTFSGNINIKEINLANLDTSNVTNMESMFEFCSNLTNLDVSTFNTSNVTNMYAMFKSCSSLTNLNVSNFDTSKVTSMESMFESCSSLTNLNVSNFDTSKVTSMHNMFADANQLTTIDLSNFKIAPGIDIQDMFFVSNITPLFVKATDPRLLQYSYNLDNRTPYPLEFQANGGTFSDGTTSKQYFADCAIEPNKATVQSVQDYAANLSLTKPGYTLIDWQNSQGIPLSKETDFNQLLTNTYTAQWQKIINPNIPQGSVNPLPDSKELLNLYALPKQFVVPVTQLNDTGKQTIPFENGNNFHIEIKDLQSGSHWQLNAQLTWQTPGLETSYIQTKNTTGQVNENQNNGQTDFKDTDLQPTTEVVGGKDVIISETENTIMRSDQNNLNGFYDYSLGQADLVIPETKMIKPGNYSGVVNWNLIAAP